MLSLVSPDGTVDVAVDDHCGARLAAVRIDGFDIVVSTGSDAVSWGCYPMVPYAGRVRRALVRLGQSTHALPEIAPPHALHGTVFHLPWAVLDHTDSRAVLLVDLDEPWPVPGTVRHEISLDNDSLTLRLEVVAHDEMPCQIGWHPWFVRPETYTVPFATMWPRDDEGIASRRPIPHDALTARLGTYDDCFSDAVAAPSLNYRRPHFDHDLVITLESDCSHWVVYDQPAHAVCIEPQSGPPNQINDDPVRIGFGESMVRTFRIGWRNTPR